jgi:hypothetical protein
LARSTKLLNQLVLGANFIAFENQKAMTQLSIFTAFAAMFCRSK